MTTELIHCLLLIIVANGSPIIGRILFRDAFNMAVDFGMRMPDGNPVFGLSKTWRGILFAITTTSMTGLLLGYGVDTGAMIALYALAGDLMSSFIKRRMGVESSGMAPLLDQVPESALPAYMMRTTFDLDKTSIVLLVLIFIISELSLSHILYRWGIRKRPY